MAGRLPQFVIDKKWLVGKGYAPSKWMERHGLNCANQPACVHGLRGEKVDGEHCPGLANTSPLFARNHKLELEPGAVFVRNRTERVLLVRTDDDLSAYAAANGLELRANGGWVVMCEQGANVDTFAEGLFAPANV